jgi:hypothetical protein
LEVSTDPAPSHSYTGGYGQVPVTDNSGNLVYPLPNSGGPIADFHQGIHVGVSNGWKNRGIIRDNVSDYHIAFQWPPNVSWTPQAGVTQASLYRSTWSIFYTGSTSQTTTNCPSTNYYKVRMNGSNVSAPAVGDPLMLIRGESHRGLVDTLRSVYDYSNGYRVLNVTADSVLLTGELATRTKLWARTTAQGNNPVADGISMIELSGARSEIILPTYLSTRNDAGGPVNILSTNNVGTLRSHPVADIYPTASGTLDFPSTAAGDVSELTINVTNAVVGRPVIVGSPASIPDKGTFSARVTAAGVVTVRFANNDLTLAKDPASGTFTVTVIQ